MIRHQQQEWMENIRGYYDRGKKVINLGCYHGTHLLVSSLKIT